MPSGVQVNGATIRRPGVFAKIDASALDARVLDIGNLAVVGNFPFLQQSTPTQVSTANALAALDPDNKDLGLLARLIYNASNDDRVSGAPSPVTLVNTINSKQAAVTLNDSAAASSVTVTSPIYGVTGNTTSIEIAANASAGKDVTVRRGGTTESFTGIGVSQATFAAKWTDNVGQFTPHGGAATDKIKTITIAYEPRNTPKFEIEWATQDAVDGQGLEFAQSSGLTYTFANLAVESALTFTFSGAPTGGDSFTLTVTGVELGQSSAGQVTEAKTQTTGDAWTTTKKWESITSVKAVCVNAADIQGVLTFKMTGKAVDISATGPTSIADYGTMSALMAYVAGKTDIAVVTTGVGATAMLPSDGDRLGATNMKGTDATLATTMYDFITKMKGSALVTVAASATGGLPPANQLASLSGGDKGSVESYSAALAALQSEDVQVIALMSTAAGDHTALKTHCNTMAGAGKNECNGWVGCPSTTAVADVYTKAQDLNTRHVSMVFQDIKFVDQFGVTKTLAPNYLAVMLASMQCATPVATPLTFKRPNVTNTAAHSGFNVNTDANTILKNGLVFIVNDRLGFKVERSVTTWTENDNAAYSEVSANESVNTCIRDLRGNLDTLIGGAAVPTTANRIKGVVRTRLRELVRLETIKAFKEDSVTVTDAGDTFRVNFEVAPMEPINFIMLTAVINRIASNA